MHPQLTISGLSHTRENLAETQVHGALHGHSQHSFPANACVRLGFVVSPVPPFSFCVLTDTEGLDCSCDVGQLHFSVQARTKART